MARDPSDSSGLRGRLRRRLDRLGDQLGERLGDPTGGRPRGARSPPCSVRFEGIAEGEVQPDTTVLAAAEALGVRLDHFCGGNCTCGTCRVEVIEGSDHLSKCQSREQMVLGAASARRGDRLACRAMIRGPVVIRVPKWF